MNKDISVNSESQQRRALLQKYMRRIALSGLAIAALLQIALFLLPTVNVVGTWIVAMFLVNSAVYMLNRAGYVNTAVNLFASFALLFIVGTSLTSYNSLMLMITGMVVLVLGAMIFLPDGYWQLYFLASLIAIVGCNVWYYQAAVGAAEQQRVIFSAITQIIVFLAGAGGVSMAYQVLSRENRERARSIDKLNANQALLLQRSAELEASNHALQRSELRFRTLVETAREAILLCELPSWQILDVNREAERLFKRSRDELLKMDGVDLTIGPSLLFGEDIEEETFFSALAKGDLLAFEQMHLDADGREFLCQVRMVTLPDEPNKVRVTVVDISEQRAVEQRERELTERFQLVSDNIPVRMVYFDRALDLQFWNKSFGSAFELNDLAPPLSARQAFGYELFNSFTEYFDGALAGVLQQFESITILDDGQRTSRVTFIPHEVEDEVVGIFAVAVDISAEINAQRELAETSEFMQLVTDNMPARLSYLTKDNTIRFLNKRYEDIGINVAEAIGRTPEEVMYAPMHTGMGEAVETALSGKPVNFERRLMRSENNERIENLKVVPHFVNEDVEGFIVLVSDVTEQRKAEEALQQAQRIESLGVLAGGIAHDFNNLLVAIQGQTSIALRRLEPEHKARKHVDKALAASERAALLTNQMLAYSGHGAFTKEPLHLNNLIDTSFSLFRVSVAQTTSFSTDLSSNLPLIDADSAQMQQVVMNLIINAGQAIGDQPGEICVSTKLVELTKQAAEQLKLVDGTLGPGRFIVMSVRDNGQGMDAATQKRIFDPFYTTKQTGSGLGLAAVLGIMRGHGGGIELISELGVGTEFKLYFPANERLSIGDPVSAEIAPQQPKIENIKVLVIDDEPSVSALVTDTLALEKITTIVYNEPLAGIDHFRSAHREIDLVILDLMMPNMNGMDVLDQLKAINPNVRVLLSSGYTHEDVASRFQGNHSATTEFIQKPYDYQQLLSKVYAALAIGGD